MNNKLPLVSVCVITYNSSDFIVETLESIKKQTYDKLELIIGDDNSNDNTVCICNKWIEANKNRFVSVKIIKQEKNNGITNNLNACLNNATGEWIKTIAGDDILLPECIEKNINFAMNNQDANFILSRVLHFNGNKFNINETYKVNDNNTLTFFSLNQEEQLNIIVRKNVIYAPTLFYNNEAMRKIGGYDLRFCFEDWPLWIKLIEKHIKMSFMKEYTVAYRHHDTNISINTSVILKPSFEYDIYKLKKDVCFKYYSKRERFYIDLDFLLKKAQIKFNLNSNNPFNKGINIIKNRVLLLIKYLLLINNKGI